MIRVKGNAFVKKGQRYTVQINKAMQTNAIKSYGLFNLLVFRKIACIC